MFESLFWSLLGLFFCTTLTHGRRGKHISLRDSSVLYAFSRGESDIEHISLRDSSYLYAFPGRESAGKHISLRDSSVLYAFAGRKPAGKHKKQPWGKQTNFLQTLNSPDFRPIYYIAMESVFFNGLSSLGSTLVFIHEGRRISTAWGTG